MTAYVAMSRRGGLSSWCPTWSFRKLRSPQPTDKPATLSFEQLHDGIRQYYQGLTAIEVEYEQITEVLSVQAEDKGTIIPRSTHHFAFKGEKRLCSRCFPPRDQPSGPLQSEMTLAFNGDACHHYQPAEMTGFIAREKDPYLDSDAYMRILAVPISDKDRSLITKTDYFLPYALDRAKLGWKVCPKLEMVDGAECHVLESKYRHRIWVDPQLGYAMRFRERYWQVAFRPVSHYLLGVRNEFGDFRQFADGMWLPERVVSVQYNTSAGRTKNLSNRVSHRTIRQVSKLAINEQIPDTLFTISFPPGTLVTDTINNRVYRN
ncbi:MAG: hypothetical protein ACLP9L_39435 [Thermoguttaceae bacterium]